MTTKSLPKKLLATAAPILLATTIAAASTVAPKAEDAKPLQPGASAPAVTLQNLDGKDVPLNKLWQESPIALVFYRGGWCPFCNTHLSNLKKIENDLAALGVQIVALSPDRPEKLNESLQKQELPYTLLSDSSASAMKAFGVAFQVDTKTVEQYKTYNIDLQEASGQPHHILPVPAVFLIDTQGTIKWVFSDPDYKKRVSNQDLLAAAKQITTAAKTTPEKKGSSSK